MGARHAASLGTLCRSRENEKGRLADRFRLDPMVPYPTGNAAMQKPSRRSTLLDRKWSPSARCAPRCTTACAMRPEPTAATIAFSDYLTEHKDPSGFKYRIPFDKQVEMFRFAIDRLKSSITPALCKEDRALWKALKLEFDGCHCLLGPNDAIVKERRTNGTG